MGKFPERELIQTFYTLARSLLLSYLSAYQECKEEDVQTKTRPSSD